MTRAKVIVVAALGLAAALHPRDARADSARCVDAAEQAQRLRDEGHYLTARARLLECGAQSCPATVQRDCMRWLTEVNEALPTVIVRATDEGGRTVSAVRVSVDGKVLVERLDGLPFAVDPGEHVFVFETAGAQPVKERVMLTAAEKNHVVAVRFASTTNEAAAPAPETRRSNVLPWVLTGIGVGAIGVGTFFTVDGLSGRSDLLDRPCAATRTCSEDDASSVRTRLIVGDVLIGAGLVSIGVAAYYFFFADDGSARAVRAGELARGQWVF